MEGGATAVFSTCWRTVWKSSSLILAEATPPYSPHSREAYVGAHRSCWQHASVKQGQTPSAPPASTAAGWAAPAWRAAVVGRWVQRRSALDRVLIEVRCRSGSDAGLWPHASPRLGQALTEQERRAGGGEPHHHRLDRAVGRPPSARLRAPGLCSLGLPAPRRAPAPLHPAPAR